MAKTRKKKNSSLKPSTSQTLKPLCDKLNLACGLDIKKDYTNMDLAMLSGVDLKWDFNNIPWPFPDNSFTEVFANHALEHTDNLINIMQEIHRVLKPKGICKVLVPYFSSPHSYSDPTHKIWFTSRTFSYFSQGHYYSPGTVFVVKRKKILFLSNNGFMKSKWYTKPLDFCINLFLPLYERLFAYILPAAEIHFELLVEKNQTTSKSRGNNLKKNS